MMLALQYFHVNPPFNPHVTRNVNLIVIFWVNQNKQSHLCNQVTMIL
jgi:hypothetical protein